MILYDVHSWRDTLLRWHGTTVRKIWQKVAAFFVYCVLVYLLEASMEEDASLDYHHSYLFGHTLAFLLVFRLNSSYQRYASGHHFCVVFFSVLRDLVMMSGTLFRGGRGQLEWNRRSGENGFSLEHRRCLDDDDDFRASLLRVDFCRWSVALAISFRIHMLLCGDGFLFGYIDEDTKRRLNFERMRMRTLLSDEEFEGVDRVLRVEDLPEEEVLLSSHSPPRPQVFHQQRPPPWSRTSPHGGSRPDPLHFQVSKEPSYRQMLVIIFKLMHMVRRTANEHFSCKERYMQKFLNLGSQLMQVHENVHQAMTTPLPLPYVNLVRTLLTMYLLCAPFFTTSDEGFWANVCMPTLMCTALLGVEEIGTELENPFGCDENDIDVTGMVAALEQDVVKVLELAGDAVALEKLTWMPVPNFIQQESARPYVWYLAWRQQVAHIKLPKGPPQTGVHIRRVKLSVGADA